MLPGIDVSHYQGVIDWKKVKTSAQVEFAWIKCTEGRFVTDPMFYRNWNEAGDADVPFGVYHFVRPEDSIPSQIDRFLEVLGAVNVGLHPFALDVEVDSITVDQVQQFLAAFPKAILYSDRAWIEEHVLLAPGVVMPLAGTPLWIAQYGVDAPESSPWLRWTFWQHTQGRVPGISVPVDLDWFNGATEDLEAFFFSPYAPGLPT